ncbi:MAG: leucyl-tRNA synthetase [Patescibacteria group bacterium]|nr:leucyl-tRNA synthetase [Patescibacteria group bacterium]
MAKERFDHVAIEKSAQEKWEALDIYTTDLTDSEKEPYYLLFEFPYPSGDLHIGHWFAFALTDIFARFKRMQGKNVLFPMGFDSFGLPAENAAIKNGADPAVWTNANMERMRAQVKTMGTSVDWSKEVVTSSPEYYKWTQWLFSKLYDHGLAYRKEAAVKWCPKDQTVLANEQVIDGKCERCDSEVEEKFLTQWFMGITKYAERLLTDLDPLPWREEMKDAQRAWIGKSEGAKLTFPILFADEAKNEWRDEEGNPAQVAVFTTRPDTVFGATYVVLAPEHPWVTGALEHGTDVFSNEKEVRAYIQETAKKTERERLENKEKTGVKLEGIRAVNPATKGEVPVYIADYVLASYGTGAVMAVPAHDERDFDFAQKFKLPIRHVIEPKFVADGDQAPISGQDFERRESACIVVYNPKDKTYLCNNWKTALMRGLFTGGIDENEDVVEAARREILEETGYTNLRHIERPELHVNTFFFHRMKGVNRWSHFTFVFFELENEDCLPVTDEESALHEIVWKSAEELDDFFTVPEGWFIAKHLDAAEYCYSYDGLLMNSGQFDGKDNREAMSEIIDFVGGEHVTNYRLRDWLVSRQRYWGCPIPVVYDPEGALHLIPSEHLPWTLPTDVDFSLSSESPLATSKELKERVERIFGEGWTPEYDTLDTFVDSSWYFLRYLDSKDENDFSDQSLLKKWLPVNRYSGGSEHTTMHLLYSRFFHKALYDLALVPTPEPFNERFNRGLILGTDGQKMSKRWGNVVNPDEVVAKFGSDAVRMYLAFIGPYNEPGSYPWKLDGAVAMRKFLDRVYQLSEKVSEGELSENERTSLAKAAKKITGDTERFKFNTAISGHMVFVRELESAETVSKEVYLALLTLMAPFAPHLAEHLWERMGGEGSVHTASWPEEIAVEEDTVVIGVQVNGKRRGEIVLAPDASEEEAMEAAKANETIGRLLHEGKVEKVVYVPGRILNLVITRS